MEQEQFTTKITKGTKYELGMTVHIRGPEHAPGWRGWRNSEVTAPSIYFVNFVSLVARYSYADSI